MFRGVRARVLLILSVTALLLAGSASGGHSKAVHHRVVKHLGAYTAIVTSIEPRQFNIYGATLRIERGGRVLFRKMLCPLSFRGIRCEWFMSAPPNLSVAHVGPGSRRAFLVELWNGGNVCCTDTFIAIPGSTIAWITREWSGANGWEGDRIRRIHGQPVFVTGDGRFFCRFSMCAGATTPIEIWKISSADRFVNVTRSYPELIRANARKLATNSGAPHQTIRRQGSGVLAAWCGDEYLLGQEARCSRVLDYAVKHRRPHSEDMTQSLSRELKRDLRRWGYAH